MPADALIATLQRQMAYDGWSNREVMASLKRVGNPPQRALELLAHVAAASDLWHARINHPQKRVTVWPALTLDRTEVYLAECEALWVEFMRDLRATDLDQSIAYTNSLGEQWSSTVGDIIQHVLFHGAYHRGQIATHLRHAGLEPAYTVFIHAARRTLI